MTANTVLSDINELYTGFILAGSKWFDPDAKIQYDVRVKQAQPNEITISQGQAVEMAKEFLKWAKNNGYRGSVKNVWWTARAGSMLRAYGMPVDQKRNPTDILVQFSSGPDRGYLGLSAKATKGTGDIGFKNPGLGTVDKNLNLNLSAKYKEQLTQTVKLLKLPETDSQRKPYIRSRPAVKKETEKIGIQILAAMRDEMFLRLKKMKQPELIEYLKTDWMDANIMLPSYVKVTGKGTTNFSADVMDPVNNPKLKALAANNITLEKVGNESIGVKAGDKKIMKIRFKFESEKMASSIKLSGDPW